MNSPEPISQSSRLPTSRVLLIAKNDLDAWLVANALDGRSTGEFPMVFVSSFADAMPLLSPTITDVILLDLRVSAGNGLDTLQSIRKSAPHIAVVALVHMENENLALPALKAGAQDYIVIERSDSYSIRRTLRYAIERKQFETHALDIMTYDPLTGLANRTLFDGWLDSALDHMRQTEEPIAVLLLNLEYAIPGNLRSAREAEEHLLKEATARIVPCINRLNTLSRFGGNEFAVLLAEKAMPLNCAMIAQKLIDALTPPFTLHGEEITIKPHIGIAIGTPDVTTTQLLEQAGCAMSRAQNFVQSNYQFYTPGMFDESLDRLQLEHELVAAIRKKSGLCLYYQPKLDIGSGKLAGAEALVRWDHPTRGMLPPSQFMPLLNRAMADELDVFVMETICRDIKCWQAAGFKPTQISVQMSNRFIEMPRIADALFCLIRKAGLATGDMEVEVKESAMLHYGRDQFDVLSRVRETSMDIYLEHNSGASSSLKLLSRHPLDAIRVDKNQVENWTNAAGHQQKQRKALIALGRALGAQIVVESVELSPSTLPATSGMSSLDASQGTINSKPIPAQEFFNWMGNRQCNAS